MAVEYFGSAPTGTGAALGQSATHPVGLHGVTPVVQAAVTTPPAATSATASSPYGYSQAQADALIVWARAIDVALKAKGIIAAA